MVFILGYVVLLILAVAGAVVAGLTATAPENSTGRKAELWTLSALLTAVALLLAAGAYWLWRFSVEFSF